MSELEVVVAAGALRSTAVDVVRFPHRWTPDGVTVDASFTGAHLLHLAVAGCVLNDVYREAERLGVQVDGVRVRASGGFDTSTWRSTGIAYDVELDSPSGAAEQAALLDAVDAVAEIPRAVRAGAPVERPGSRPAGVEGRVTGIGGVFFRSTDPDQVAAWYEQHLRVTALSADGEPWRQEAGPTVWAPFPQDTEYFGGRDQQTMVNFRVADLDALLTRLHAAGVDPDDEVVEQAGVGRFAHVRDPAGSRVELWEPADG